MTESRYKDMTMVRELYMTDREWFTFLKEIPSSCYFKVSNYLPIAEEQSLYSVSNKCDIEIRYYSDDNTTYYHITNDSRRKIHRFLSHLIR